MKDPPKEIWIAFDFALMMHKVVLHEPTPDSYSSTTAMLARTGQFHRYVLEEK